MRDSKKNNRGRIKNLEEIFERYCSSRTFDLSGPTPMATPFLDMLMLMQHTKRKFVVERCLNDDK